MRGSPLGYLKILRLYVSGRKVGPKDYSREYDRICPTYGRWQERMGGHTRRIVRADLLPDRLLVKVLDFACGTGFISRELLKAVQKSRIEITAVDSSVGMIDVCRREIRDPRFKAEVADGILFLKGRPAGSFDAIFSAWALPYFDHDRVIGEWARVASSGAIVGVILDRGGTLRYIEKLIVRLMVERRESVRKVMDIRFSIPADMRTMDRRFARRGFFPLDGGTGEEVFTFTGAEELYQWLSLTGVIAGVASIFSPDAFPAVERELIGRIGEALGKAGRYEVNHKFLWRVYRGKD